jgi:hypothetical protein
MRWWVLVAALWVCGPWLAYWWQRRKADRAEDREADAVLREVEQRAKQDAAERLAARIRAGEGVLISWDEK